MKSLALIGLSVAIVALAPKHSFSADGPPPPMNAAARARVDAEMLRLELGTRIEQRCNRRAMGLVRREHWPMNPDEAVARAFAEPEEIGPEVRATGAAIRSRGEWYRIAFDCVTTENGLEIKSFRYSLGAPVPKSEWKDHSLVEP